jgi:hypothetical protein
MPRKKGNHRIVCFVIESFPPLLIASVGSDIKIDEHLDHGVSAFGNLWR